jgi:site-specific recombinase XerD
MTNWQSGTSGTIKYLNEGQLRRFFSAVRVKKKAIFRHRDICLFSLMLSYGLREAEAVRIQLKDINLRGKDKLIFIRRVKSRHSENGRWYLVSGENAELIKAWLKRRKRLSGASSNPWLFITQMSGEKGHMSEDQLFHIFKQYAKRAGISWAYPHTLRHTCGVRLAAEGFNAFAIRDRLGHRSVLSSQVYVEMCHPDKIQLDAKMDAALRF